MEFITTLWKVNCGDGKDSNGLSSVTRNST